MKNKSTLTITLYAFTVISLAYSTYYLFSTYEQIASYYSSYNVSTGTILVTLISSCFQPFMMTVILFGLAGVSDMCYQIIHLATEEVEEKVEEEKIEEPKEAEGN